MNSEEYFKKLDKTSTALFDIALGHDSTEDRYNDMGEIGRGATKTIHKVLDLSSGRTVALALPNEQLNDEQIYGFLEEARLNASLQHPNIIQVYNLGYRQDGKPFFTMKLCSKKKLSEILQGSSKNLFELIDIFLKVCDALAYAHSMGAIHRDIKDDNILLGDFGEVLVCDWGSAQILKSSILEQEVGQLSHPISKGTPGFMSPEQLQNAPISVHQDIYSLGALLYKILTKEAPSDPLLSPREINPDIPFSLEAICLKSMHQERAHRYQNCDELINDLKAYISGFAPLAEKASIQKQIRLFFFRHKTLTLSVIFSLIFISAFSVYYVFSLKEKERQTSIQRDRAEHALELYDIEKSSRRKIAALGADYFIIQANQLISAHSAQLALDLLDSIPPKSLDEQQLKQINTSYGRIYFYRQRFKQAIEYLQKGEAYKDGALLKIAQEFVEKKDLDSDLFDTKNTLEIIDSLYAIELHQVHCFFREEVLRIEDYQAQIPIIHKMIMLNNSIDTVKISYTVIEGKRHLDLSHNLNMHRWEPVREMGLSSLNLSNSPIKDHSHVLNNMPLEILNISYTPIKKFNFLKKLKSLKTLIIDKQMAKNKSLKQMTKKLDLTIQIVD